ncbi:hypothetical protein BTJ68_10713 [Hortaea werneckii EXF-2000]|uniref:Uncharacterized protein n=1 Tax=Hortaea werneckii EXF-2000 TaxID=1157616 RepID=A0A1Z5SW87_HORWE|nr:hypothetical protein BTJ68_10713 [Hortaea werneckii EXF-2000]
MAPPLPEDLPASALPVSAMLFKADTDIQIFTNDGAKEIGEYSTTTQTAGLPVDVWVWFGPKYSKFSSDGIRVVARSGDNDAQTYLIRYTERNGHCKWHRLPGLCVQRPSGEWVYDPYRMTPQHPNYDREKHEGLERPLLYDPKHLYRLEFTLIKFKKPPQAGSQSGSTDGQDSFMRILVDREQSESEVVVAKPHELNALGGKDGGTTYRDLVNAAGHESAPAPSQLAHRPAFPATGRANAQHYPPSEMPGAPPGGYYGHAAPLSNFSQPAGVYGQAYLPYGRPPQQYRYNFDYPRVGNEEIPPASEPAPGQQALADFNGRAHMHGLPTHGRHLGMPLTRGEETPLRSEMTPRQQSRVPSTGRDPAPGRPMHETQPSQYDQYGRPIYGYEGVHSEYERRRGRRAPRNTQSTALRNTREAGNGGLPAPPAGQPASRARQHDRRREDQRTSLALPASQNAGPPPNMPGAAVETIVIKEEEESEEEEGPGEEWAPNKRRAPKKRRVPKKRKAGRRKKTTLI